MKLAEYFSTEPLGARGEMAEYLGISLTWMSLLIHERRTASAALAVKIEKATQGLVTRKDSQPSGNPLGIQRDLLFGVVVHVEKPAISKFLFV